MASKPLFIRDSEGVRGRVHAAVALVRSVSDDGERKVAHGRRVVIDRHLFIIEKGGVPGEGPRRDSAWAERVG